MDFFHPALLVFTTSIILLLSILLMEVFSLLLGGTLSDMIDGLIPDLDADFDVDGPDGPDIADAGLFTQFFAWLSVGKVPVLMLLAVFMGAFGTVGLVAQNLVRSATGFYLHAAFLTVPVFLAALFVTRHAGLLLTKYLPKEETDAVSTDTFIGLIAVVIRGEATKGQPAEAKLKDRNGKTHYILLEPDEEELVLKAGDTALIVEQRGAVFAAIENTSAALAN